MPVLQDGRLKPVDTFARSVVTTICGQENPRLSLSGAMAGDVAMQDDSEEGVLRAGALASALSLFPEGKPRAFTASELLLLWIADPDAWSRVPFLPAGHEALRRDLLELPLADTRGNRLKFASPWQVLHARKFQERIGEIERRRESEGRQASLDALDKKASQLMLAYHTFLAVAYPPTAEHGIRARYLGRLRQVQELWPSLASDLRRAGTPGENDTFKPVAAIGPLVEELVAMVGSGDQQTAIPLDKADAAVAKLRVAAAEVTVELDARLKRLSTAAAEDVPQRESATARFRTLKSVTLRLEQLLEETHRALHDNGYSLELVPALTAAALEKNRDTSAEISPWLSIHAVLSGSRELLKAYPQEPLADVRKSYRQLVSAAQGNSQSHRQELASAVAEFARSVRVLGEAIEPIRRELPTSERDEAVMAATAYPRQGFTDIEVCYNRLDPFFWSWVLCLAGLVLFAVGIGPIRKPAFWLGLLLVVAAQAATIGGLALRVGITGWVPVTNMFETVVFVSLVTAVLALWFTVLPLVTWGVHVAWRMTAYPRTWEAVPLGEDDRALEGSVVRGVRYGLIAVRTLLGAGLFYVLALTSAVSMQGHRFFALRPRQTPQAWLPSTNDAIVWLVAMSVLALAVWYIPRWVVATAASLVTVPVAWWRQGLARPLEGVLARKTFAAVGAAVAFLAAYLAYYVPTVDREIFDKGIRPLMPILRSNFWLTAHVLTITASYGAGALAWGLGNLALVHYLFGRYRPVGEMSPEIAAAGHRPAAWPEGMAPRIERLPPRICTTLGEFNYKATQIAVLLLATGTILGALWADVAWGRFWSWDPKEVWALISLLIYLAVLHGRYAGLFGNFGLALGSVVGATGILMAWYGVNFVLGSGMHSYGGGRGGVWGVLVVVLANWVFAGFAAARHLAESRDR